MAKELKIKEIEQNGETIKAVQIKLRESFIKHDNKLFTQLSRLLIDEFLEADNGRKEAEQTVSEADVDSAIKYGILQPIIVSVDPQKRVDPLTGLPMLRVHSGGRRTLMVEKAKEANFKGHSNSTPLLMCSTTSLTDECLPCLPIVIDKAERYEDRADNIARQLVLNSHVNWSPADLIEAAIEFVDTEGQKAEDFATAAGMKREAVQRLLRIGRVEGLVQALRSGQLKNTAIADAVASFLIQNEESSLEEALKAVGEMAAKQTAKNVKEALNGAGINDGNTEGGSDDAETTGGINDDNEGGSDDSNNEGGSDDGGNQKPEKYNFCKNLLEVANQAGKDGKFDEYTASILSTLAAMYEGKEDALTMYNEILSLSADRMNLVEIQVKKK